MKFAFSILVRVLMLVFLFSLPLLAATFIEWSPYIGSWSKITRAGVGITWVSLLLALAFIAFEESKAVRSQIRKDHGL